MKIAVVAPSPVPFVIGGAEKLWWGLTRAINALTGHQAELIKVPSPEGSFPDLIRSYRRFSRLDLSHFDLLISTKYPAWMVSHPRHLVYMQHTLRGLYDTYPGPEQEPLPRHPELEFLGDLLRQPPGSDLARRILDETRRLLQNPETAGLFVFPGPLTRAVIRALDRAALDPGRIERYCAISATVAGRKAYFPPGVEPEVVYHPSDLEGFANTGYEHLFVPGRLDPAKRLDLLIKAFRRTRTRVELIIGGAGPEEERLKSLAAGDERIRFLGFVTDQEVLEYYARALFVPYIPYDEDYGLVTVEAMNCCKAVLTASDAGGVNEFVRHEVNGLCVPPETEALSRAMDRLAADPETARTMGLRGRVAVRDIGWEQTVGALLGPSKRGRSLRGRVRPKLVLATSFPIWPPRGGGQRRIFHLYREVARRAEVRLVTLGDHGQAGKKAELAPGLWEIRVPKSRAHQDAEFALQGRARAPVADIAAVARAHLTPELPAQLEAASQGARAAVASHPYLFPVLEQACACELWHESHNCELDLKTEILKDCSRPEELLDLVRRAEGAAVCRSRLVTACSREDANRLGRLYGRDPGDILILPNGVDSRAVPFVASRERRARRARLGLEQGALALFMGSLHGPNQEAAAHILALAPACPDVLFLLIGSLCQALNGPEVPPNVKPLGILREREKSVLLGAADAALNPVTGGSGTNLKLLEYAAAGAPILSTPFGTRGTAFTSEHLLSAEVEDFPGALQELLGPGAEAAAERAAAARELVESRYDWSVIARPLLEVLVGTGGER